MNPSHIVYTYKIINDPSYNNKTKINRSKSIKSSYFIKFKGFNLPNTMEFSGGDNISIVFSYFYSFYFFIFIKRIVNLKLVVISLERRNLVLVYSKVSLTFIRSLSS